MPPPGPSFIKAAQLLGDGEVVLNKDGGRAYLPEAHDRGNLRMLHAYALYEPWFVMNVVFKRHDYPCHFMPGHLIGDPRPRGPRAKGVDVMVVYKMPEPEDVNTGRLLSGPSGQILLQVVSELGVTQSEFSSWYVTCVARFPHPRPTEGTGLSEGFLKDCLPLLHQEIRLLRPRVILCLGNEAAKGLLGKDGGITSSANRVHEVPFRLDVMRGMPCQPCDGLGYTVRREGRRKVMDPCTLCGGRGREVDDPASYSAKVVTTLSPKMVVMTPDTINQFRGNVKTFTYALRGVTAAASYPDYHVCDTEEALAAEVDRIVALTPGKSWLAVDAEWHGMQPHDPDAYMRTVQVSHTAGHALCVPIKAAGGAEVFRALDGTLDHRAAIPHLKRLLLPDGDRAPRIAGHFFRADMPQIRYHLGIDLLPGHEAPPDDGSGVAHYATAWGGGMDTGLAAHAVCETDEYKLEVLGSRYTDIARWDGPLQAWKKAYRTDKGIKAKELRGYGDCPDGVLFADPPFYAMADADATRRLVDLYNGLWNGRWDMASPGLLDNDGFGIPMNPPPDYVPHPQRSGLCCRQGYWTAMRAVPAFLEMETTGLLADRAHAERLIMGYRARRRELLQELREELNWNEPTNKFSPASAAHCRELLFGLGFSGVNDPETNTPTKRVSPSHVKLLNLPPVKATSKLVKSSWDELVRTGQEKLFTPATDKEVLGILSALHPVARKLRNMRFLSQLVSSTLRQPTQVWDGTYTEVWPSEEELARRRAPKPVVIGGKIEYRASVLKPVKPKRVKNYVDKAGEKEQFEYDGGLLYFASPVDGRIRTSLFQTLESGRCASARPNLQSLSKRREDDYKRIMGDRYVAPVRSIFVAPPGHVLIEADILGAELALMAWDSQDAKMIDHVSRAMLSESDPLFYDIHSNIAVLAFQLKVNASVANPKKDPRTAAEVLGLPVGAPCPPTKYALGLCGYASLRVAAKNVVFGYAYGRGAEAISRQCKEEGAEVSVAQAQQLIDGLVVMYPMLQPFFQDARDRVQWTGWQRSDFGYLCRTVGSNDRKTRGDIERRFMNFRLQNGVAGAISRGLDHLVRYRAEHPDVHYKLCMQIHDAVLLEVPYAHVERVYDEVLPECMTRRVPVWPCDFDGERLPQITEPYYFGIEKDVMLRWGVKMTKEECRERGIPERFGK